MAPSSEADARAAHEALTTTAHGGLVAPTDPRLTDARTPTAHAASHATGGTDPITAASIGAALAAWSPAPIRKPSDESVTASTAFQNDDHLFFAVGANEAWAYELRLFIDGPTLGDWKGTLTSPVGAAVVAGSMSLHVTATSVSGGVRIDTLAGGFFSATLGVGTPTMVSIAGSILNGATPGDLRLQWAQFASDPGATRVLAGSFLTRRRIA